jgi:peptidyl-prolyl cis-trans isomerase D
MLKAMRKNLKSLKPVLWIVVGTFILAIFAIWGGGQFGGSAPTDRLATVGGEKISADEYYQNLRQRLEGMQKEFQGLSADLVQQLNIPQQILEQLIQQRLLLQVGKELGLRASDAETRKRIMSYFEREGQFIGYDEYKRILEYNRMSVRDFERSIEKEVLIGKVVEVMTAGISVTEEEAWDAFRKEGDSAKIEYLISDRTKVEVSETPSEDEILAAFEKKKDEYRIAEKRTADYIFIRGEDVRGEVTVDDPEIQKYYEDNLAQFQEPEKTRVSRIFLPFTDETRDGVLAEARDLLSRIGGGEDFASLARARSQDEKAGDGGDWGYFDWRTLSGPETAAASSLEAGAVSGVVETDGGASLLKVTEKTPEITKPLDEVRDTVRSILEDRKTRDLVSVKIQRLERLARREKSLDVAAQKESLKARSTGPLKKGEGLGDFDPSGAVSEALFTLEENEISTPVYTYEGAGLAQLRAVEAERPATLVEVRSEVEADILTERKSEKARDRLLAFKTSPKKDWNLEASKTDLEYKTVDAHKREQYLSLVGEQPEVDRLVFSLPLQEVSDPVAVESGFAIFRVLERTEVTREDFEADKAAEIEKVLEQKKNRFLQSTIVKAREKKGVRINYDLFLQINSEILSRFSGTG